MPIRHEIDPQRKLIIWRASGEGRVRGLYEAAISTMQDPLWRPSYDIIIHVDAGSAFHQLDLSAFSELNKLVGKTGIAARDTRLKCAIVCVDDARQQVLSLWEALCKADQRAVIEPRAFTTEEEALDWLGRGVPLTTTQGVA